MDLALYNNEECSLAAENLAQHVNGKEMFSLQAQSGALGIPITEDLSKKNCRQSYYKDCVFDFTKCQSTGFSGSKFVNTIFKNCELGKANLHSCDFKDVTFIGINDEQFKIVGAGFHKSTFVNCVFQNLYIFSCGFTDVVFHNTIFKGCTIRLCSLESAQFKNCSFINNDMSTVNLEYTEFDNINASQTVFPFVTIPSAYGLLQQLPFLGDDNAIYSAANKLHRISIPEYLELLNDFERFYYKKEKYYALANVYISQGKVEDCFKTIEAGILNTIKIKDFRILRHFCKLVYLSDIFTIHQRRNLYENINKWVSQEYFTLPEYHNYQLFTGSIREMLLNGDYRKPTIYFYLQTNIDPNEIQKQVIFLTIVEKVLEYCDVPLSSIELRHNSEFVDFLTVICDNLTQFSQVLIMIYSSLAGIRLFSSSIEKIAESTQSIIANYDQHKSRKLEQEKLQLEINAIRNTQEHNLKMEEIEYKKALAELEKLNLELENMKEQSDKYQQILLENGIKISVKHTSKNLKAAPIREMIQYNQ